MASPPQKMPKTTNGSATSVTNSTGMRRATLTSDATSTGRATIPNPNGRPVQYWK